jgi:hypothetical protein
MRRIWKIRKTKRKKKERSIVENREKQKRRMKAWK